MYKLPSVFVVPADGVKMPLPIDGMRIPAEGMTVQRNVHIERLLRTGDLLEGEAATKLLDARTANAAKEAAAKEPEAAKNKPPATEEAKVPEAAMAPSPAIAPAADSKTQQGAAGSKG